MSAIILGRQPQDTICKVEPLGSNNRLEPKIFDTVVVIQVLLVLLLTLGQGKQADIVLKSESIHVGRSVGQRKFIFVWSDPWPRFVHVISSLYFLDLYFLLGQRVYYRLPTLLTQKVRLSNVAVLLSQTTFYGEPGRSRVDYYSCCLAIRRAKVEQCFIFNILNIVQTLLDSLGPFPLRIFWLVALMALRVNNPSLLRLLPVELTVLIWDVKWIWFELGVFKGSKELLCLSIVGHLGSCLQSFISNRRRSGLLQISHGSNRVVRILNAGEVTLKRFVMLVIEVNSHFQRNHHCFLVQTRDLGD